MALTVEIANNRNICEIVNEFNDFSQIIEVTNVFQLRVNEAKYHLENLRRSLLSKSNESSDENGHESVLNSIDIVSSNLKEQLALVPGDLHVNNLFNTEQTIPVSDLLSDTCLLISRLEFDRSNVEQEITKQKLKVEKLLENINNISYFRMEMLPSAVQKEHEACANDISELHWHIKHRTQIEKKLRQKRNKAAEINEELLLEIRSIKEHIPLVQEKLNLEESIMNKIQETKEKLIKDSATSEERQRVTKEKHDEANKKVASEQLHIKRDLHKANKALTSVQKSLQHGEKEYTKLIEFRARSEEKIRQNHIQITKLNADNESKKLEQSNLEEKVDKLDRNNRELQFDGKRLNNTLLERMKMFEDQEAEQEKNRLEINKTKQNLEHRLVELKRTNRQLEIEITEIKESQEKATDETAKLRTNTINSKEDIRESETRFEKAVEEFSIISRQHASVQQRLAEETRKIQEMEEHLRRTLSDVEQGIKQEILTKSNFQSKIVKDTQDLDNSRTESLEKQKQMQKSLKEVLLATKEAKNKVAEIESQHVKSNSELKKFETEFEDLEKFIEVTKTEKKKIIDNLTPVFNELKGKLDAIIQKEELFDWQVQTMNSQLVEVTHSEGLITKSKKKVQETLLDLERNYNNVALELEICRKHIIRTEATISQLTTQSNRYRVTHENYLLGRQQILMGLEKDLENSLAINKTLAAQYRSLQTDYYTMLDGFLDVIQEQLWGENNIKFIKEVQRLQKFMHNNLEIFFALKLMYDDNLFFDLCQQSGDSEEKVKEIRLKYMEHIETVKEFLESNFSIEYQKLITQTNHRGNTQ